MFTPFSPVLSVQGEHCGLADPYFVNLLGLNDPPAVGVVSYNNDSVTADGRRLTGLCVCV